MHTIHLASTHHPFDSRIFHRECQSLVKAGYRVSLIVPHERSEVVDGVQILAVPPPRSGRERLTVTLRQIYALARSTPPDALLHVHDAELLPYMLLLRLQGRRLVYDAHEDTPLQALYQHWIPKILRRPVGEVMRVVEALTGWFFEGVIAAEPVIARRYPRHKTILVHNFPLVNELVLEDSTPYVDRAPVVTYIGSLSEVRGIREVVQAMAHVPTEAELLLGGRFYPAAFEREVTQLPGWDRTRFVGWLTRPAMAEALAQARVGVVTLHPVPRYLGNYPTKLFEYMAAGLPVVVSDFPQLRPFVEEHRCGVLVNPLDPKAIGEAIAWLLEHPEEAAAMGQRGRDAVRDRYNWDREAARLIQFYGGLALAAAPEAGGRA
ncbi:MAG: glycosyltransferase family 4 protein [Bacteroidota bacterium]